MTSLTLVLAALVGALVASIVIFTVDVHRALSRAEQNGFMNRLSNRVTATENRLAVLEQTRRYTRTQPPANPTSITSILMETTE